MQFNFNTFKIVLVKNESEKQEIGGLRQFLSGAAVISVNADVMDIYHFHVSRVTSIETYGYVLKYKLYNIYDKSN